MDWEHLFLWCTVLNGSLLLVSFLFCVLARESIYRLHSRWFPMPRESFSVLLYSFLGFFKILVIAFNLVPWIVLRWLVK
ncbi:MAG TPA: hypothetical protein PKX93_02835 [bacterium]|nr:hypothetical protein [bacterium]HOL66376.1 hypothetical protein [bacterium]HPP11551.1 hypothetical protein [bacterium]